MSAYTTHCVEDHEAFTLGVLLSRIVGYARASNTLTEVVVLASFMSLMALHKAPEGLR